MVWGWVRKAIDWLGRAIAPGWFVVAGDERVN